MQSGGSYIIGPDGVPVREGGTDPHPEGEAPRLADGRMIGGDGLPVPHQVPANTSPAPALNEEE